MRVQLRGAIPWVVLLLLAGRASAGAFETSGTHVATGLDIRVSVPLIAGARTEANPRIEPPSPGGGFTFLYQDLFPCHFRCKSRFGAMFEVSVRIGRKADAPEASQGQRLLARAQEFLEIMERARESTLRNTGIKSNHKADLTSLGLISLAGVSWAQAASVDDQGRQNGFFLWRVIDRSRTLAVALVFESDQVPRDFSAGAVRGDLLKLVERIELGNDR
jgi:hypothetical protein